MLAIVKYSANHYGQNNFQRLMSRFAPAHVSLQLEFEPSFGFFDLFGVGCSLFWKYMPECLVQLILTSYEAKIIQLSRKN